MEGKPELLHAQRCALFFARGIKAGMQLHTLQLQATWSPQPAPSLTHVAGAIRCLPQYSLPGADQLDPQQWIHNNCCVCCSHTTTCTPACHHQYNSILLFCSYIWQWDSSDALYSMPPSWRYTMLHMTTFHAICWALYLELMLGHPAVLLRVAAMHLYDKIAFPMQ